MNTANDAATRARWQVIWVKDRRIHRVGTGDDMHEALRLYGLAVASPERTNVTLRCQNMGFPPPVKYRPRVVTFDKPRRLKDGTPVTSVRVVPMAKLNRNGIWWCPFCIQLRRFVFEKGWWTQEQVWMAEPRMRCPVCSVSHDSMEVRKWNPLAARLFYAPQTHDPNGPPPRRRRRKPKEDS